MVLFDKFKANFTLAPKRYFANHLTEIPCNQSVRFSKLYLFISRWSTSLPD